MRTQTVAAAVMALGLISVVAARAEGPPVPIHSETPGGVAIDVPGGEDGPVEIEALADGRIGFRMRRGAGQKDLTIILEPLPDKRLRLVGRDEHTLECSHLTLNIQRDEESRRPPTRQDRLDDLDEARASSELMRIEIEALKAQIQKMTAFLSESRLMEIQGFSSGPILGGNNPEERTARIQKYEEKLNGVRAAFLDKSKALSREQRRVVELEKALQITAASPSPQPGGLPWKDADRVFDLILKGVETWQRASAPSTSPPPSDPGSKDTDRLLDLIRKGVETWQGGPSPSPSPSPTPADPRTKDVDRILGLIRKGVETWQGPPPPSSTSPAPAPPPAEPPLKDADRILELILRGVENWQRQ